eukprot:15028171-Alexandrium_andersonii.AAC.1
MRPYHVWSVSKHVSNESFFFHEITPRRKNSTLERNIPSRFGLKRIVTSPQDLGWPVARPRAFSFGFDRDVFIWCGPESDTDIQHEFDMLFQESNECDAGVFEIAPSDRVMEFLSSQARARGSFLRE